MARVMGRAPRSPLGAKTTLPLFAAVVRPIQVFLRLEAASGIVLLSCAVAALVLANSGASEVYRAILGAPVELAAGSLRARFSVAMLVNDGLMTIFFFVVGLEIKRELAVGELRTLRKRCSPRSPRSAGCSSRQRCSSPSTGTGRGGPAGGSRWRPTSRSVSAS